METRAHLWAIEHRRREVAIRRPSADVSQRAREEGVRCTGMEEDWLLGHRRVRRRLSPGGEPGFQSDRRGPRLAVQGRPGGSDWLGGERMPLSAGPSPLGASLRASKSSLTPRGSSSAGARAAWAVGSGRYLASAASLAVDRQRQAGSNVESRRGGHMRSVEEPSMAGTAVLPAACPRIKTPGPPWDPCPPPTNSPNNPQGDPTSKKEQEKVPEPVRSAVRTCRRDTWPKARPPTGATRSQVPPYRARPASAVPARPASIAGQYVRSTQLLGGLRGYLQYRPPDWEGSTYDTCLLLGSHTPRFLPTICTLVLLPTPTPTPTAHGPCPLIHTRYVSLPHINQKNAHYCATPLLMYSSTPDSSLCSLPTIDITTTTAAYSRRQHSTF